MKHCSPRPRGQPRDPARPRSPRRRRRAEARVNLCLSIDFQQYDVRGIPCPTPEFGTGRAYHLEKHSSKGEGYDVIRNNFGLVECSCPSYVSTFEGTSDTCKHGKALVALGLIEAPRYTPRATDWETGRIAPVAATAAPARAAICDCFGTLLSELDLAEGRCEECRERAVAVAAADLLAAIPAAEVATCCDPAEADPCGGCSESPGFADALHEAIGPPPIEPPTEASPRAADGDGRNAALVALIEAEAARTRTGEGGVHDLMADALAELAAKVKWTKAGSIPDYLDRIQVIEHDRDKEMEARGYDLGIAAGRDQQWNEIADPRWAHAAIGGGR